MTSLLFLGGRAHSGDEVDTDFDPFKVESDLLNQSLLIYGNKITLGPHSFVLKNDEVIRADQIVIDGPIFTHGYQLIVEARQVIFTEKGSIQGYSFCAPAQEQSPSVAALTTESNLPTPLRVHPLGIKNHELTSIGNDGVAGGAGNDGETGYCGMNGEKNPKPIYFFAAQVLGTPKIICEGQSGGVGGTGGKGGAGGDGGPGGPAHATYNGSTSTAGRGGAGGRGGRGGKGGTGGKGGCAIPFVFLTNQSLKELDKRHLHSFPGLGGQGGKPGLKGDPGRGGVGGKGDAASLLWNHMEISNGPMGVQDLSDPGNLGKGDLGEVGLNRSHDDPFFSVYTKHSKNQLEQIENGILISFQLLENERRKVHESWFAFSFVRSLKFFFEESISRIHSTEQLNIGTSGHQSERVFQLQEGLRQLIRDSWELNTRKLTQHVMNSDLDVTILAKTRQYLSILTELIEKVLKIKNVSEAKPLWMQLQSQVHDQINKIIRHELEQAILRCVEYNRAKLELFPQLSAHVSSYFEIPLCNGDVDLSDPQQIDSKLILTSEIKSVAPPGLKSEPIQVKLDTGFQATEEEESTQKDLQERLDALMERFADLLTAHPVAQKQVAVHVQKVEEAVSVKDLIQSKFKFEKLYFSQAQIKMEFERGAHEVSDLFLEYRNLKGLNQTVPTKLNLIIEEIKSHYSKVQLEIEGQFSLISKSLDRILSNQFKEWEKKYDEKKRQNIESLRFVDEVGEVIYQLNFDTIQRQEMSNKPGDPLKSRYEIYQNILTYKDQCSDLKHLENIQSPLLAGCTLIGDYIKEAEFFLNAGAWGPMSVTLFNIYNPPNDVIADIKVLRKMRKERETKEVGIYEAILLHDSILEKIKKEREASL